MDQTFEEVMKDYLHDQACLVYGIPVPEDRKEEAERRVKDFYTIICEEIEKHE